MTPLTFRECLNRALDRILAEDDRAYILGEDILDPYGGAFKVTTGLSTRYPGRVRSTPVSEAGIIGVSIGMALAGLHPIVEIMFADFLTLGFDQLFNHATKFPYMYDGRAPCPVVVRTPTGAGRGYGPTHSQCPEKYFLGMPGLTVVAANHHTDPYPLIKQLQNDRGPSLLIEHKGLYAQPMWTGERLGEAGWQWLDFKFGEFPARALSLVEPRRCHMVVVAYGEFARRLEEVVMELALEDEIFCLLVCPTRLNPSSMEPLWQLARPIGRLVFAEEGAQGWSWGTEWAYRAQVECGSSLEAAPVCLASRADIIPCNIWRESETILTTERLTTRLRELAR